jgi:hypothetical protein
MLCQYKYALGIPGQGVHKHFFGVAIADCIMTVLGAWFLSFVFKWSFWYTLIGFFLLGIALHRLFCVETTLDKFLFKN